MKSLASRRGAVGQRVVSCAAHPELDIDIVCSFEPGGEEYAHGCMIYGDVAAAHHARAGDQRGGTADDHRRNRREGVSEDEPVDLDLLETVAPRGRTGSDGP